MFNILHLPPFVLSSSASIRIFNPHHFRFCLYPSACIRVHLSANPYGGSAVPFFFHPRFSFSRIFSFILYSSACIRVHLRFRILLSSVSLCIHLRFHFIIQNFSLLFGTLPYPRIFSISGRTSTMAYAFSFSVSTIPSMVM